MNSLLFLSMKLEAQQKRDPLKKLSFVMWAYYLWCEHLNTEDPKVLSKEFLQQCWMVGDLNNKDGVF